jgi:iron complex outermembrane receptor protein
VVDTGTSLPTSPLDAEKSFNFSGGYVFRAGGFDRTVDACRIKLCNQLALSDNIGTWRKHASS